MRTRIPIALGTIAIVAAVLGGCSKHDKQLDPQLHFRAGDARPDTVPKPHPTPPPDSSLVPVQFMGADSTAAGQSGVSRWLLGNASRKPFTMPWILTAEPGWPGFPIQGTLRLGGRRIEPLSVVVPVPAFATTGIHELRMIVVTAAGDSAFADGAIRVFGNDPPPPPPPPPPAVVFVGADSVRAGETGATQWELGNESGHAFTMLWTLRSGGQWPGFPKQGAENLGPNERRVITVSVPVPDTAAAGLHRLEMEVTRPDSLPPASSPGGIFVVP
jgi:hypothetical protein